MDPHPSHAPRESSAAAVWAPWLAAPLFALLPIGGCGVAGALGPSPQPAVNAAAAAMVAPAAPVVTVVTLGDRQMARGAMAD